MERPSDRAYWEACWASLKAGMVVYPRHETQKRKCKDAEVVFLDKVRGEVVLRTQDAEKGRGKARTIKFKSFCSQWMWDGKPVKVYSTGARVVKAGDKTLREMVMDLVGRMERLEKGLGVGV